MRFKMEGWGMLKLNFNFIIRLFIGPRGEEEVISYLSPSLSCFNPFNLP